MWLRAEDVDLSRRNHERGGATWREWMKLRAQFSISGRFKHLSEQLGPSLHSGTVPFLLSQLCPLDTTSVLHLMCFQFKC